MRRMHSLPPAGTVPFLLLLVARGAAAQQPADTNDVVAAYAASEHAIAMRDGPEAGLQIVDRLLADGRLDDYQFAHAARADLCRRLGRRDEARAAYARALELTRQEPERRFLQRRLGELATQ